MTAFDPDAVRPKTWPATPHDHLPMPGNRTLGKVSTIELTRLAVGLGIPGASHEHGRATNAEAYARHIERLRNEGATAAVNAWLFAQSAGERVTG